MNGKRDRNQIEAEWGWTFAGLSRQNRPMIVSSLLATMMVPAMPAQAAGIRSVQVGESQIVIRFDDVVGGATSFVLAGPDRIAIDVADAEPGPAALPAGSLVSSVRQGRPDLQSTRVVLDLARPAILGRSSFSADGKALTLAIAPASIGQFEAAARSAPRGINNPVASFSKPPRSAYSVSTTIDPVKKGLPRPKIYGPKGRPLIVIDAGHGGHDPGAISPHGGQREKDITLSVARKIRDEIIAAGRFRVALTREDDRFLVLRERSAIAKNLGANLFISIHADSAGGSGATGATIYTLSETASDVEAGKLAARENKADILNGVNLGGENAEIASILVDLAQRETMNSSANFANLLRRESSGDLRLRSDFHRMAGFAVLKQPDMPSILLEIGYLTNADDVDRIASENGQRRIATGLRKAIDIHFAQRVAMR
ncbi:MAG TPA: N-acetylmuramoyl-L-alanine amidase [Chakrabartia sp.]|jgi:N-acetylmuramoyl-L-alanine amidase|nr:N-acetylmuramoyl-L-alanine amidase [Chakrabartia sp.]